MSTQDTYGRTHIGPESYSESTNLPPIAPTRLNRVRGLPAIGPPSFLEAICR